MVYQDRKSLKSELACELRLPGEEASVVNLARVSAVGVVLFAGGWIAGFSEACRDDQSAEQILKALDTIKIPIPDASKKRDESYSRQFLTELQTTTESRAALILKLYRTAPDHDRIPELMAERWSVRPFGLSSDRLHAEIDDVLKSTKNQRLKLEAIYGRAYARLYDSRPNDPLDLSLVEAYLGLAPKDPRGAGLLRLAVRRTRDGKVRAALEDRVIREFPESTDAQQLLGMRHSGDQIGKPFDLEFTDAVSGASVSLKNLAGKVVVIDFWATWCGPCVAELPEMKALYARYHNRGVDFVGVSLDKPKELGGLDSLKKLIREQQIDWPQYYQGDGWDSKFSSACGIHEIPAVFVIDKQGKLYSTDARGKLDVIIPELLDRSAAPSRSDGARQK